MRTKLTVTIDEELLPKAKRHARSQKMSLSRLIESALRGLTAEDKPSFSRRWRGRFRPAGRKDQRDAALAKKYLGKTSWLRTCSSVLTWIQRHTVRWRVGVPDV